MKVLIMYATAGHGHKKAAEYLCEELERRKREYGSDIEIVSTDLFKQTPAAFVKTYPVSYEFMVSKVPWFWGFSYWLTNMQWFARLVAPIRRFYNKINSRQLEQYLITEAPDVLLFTHFFPPEVSTYLKRKGRISSQIVTVVTDFFAHSTWINKGTDHFVVMTDESKQALARWGIPPETINVLGIPVGAKFQYNEDKRDVRARLGIEQERLTLLLTSGSFGIGPFEEVLSALEAFKDSIQALIVCGNNKHLFEALSKKQFPYPVKVNGFIDNMHEFMDAADVIIAKSGGITTCESLAKSVPMIITSPIPGQETGNARYLIEHDCAFELKRPKDIAEIIGSIVRSPEVLREKIENIQKVRKPQATKHIIDLVLSLKK
ncbi:MAG: glycosyltransferase [Candidatus Omnitrophica bacterium]|nr:glycosyltransferase [Candidatus Omnitrophota bacterium]